MRLQIAYDAVSVDVQLFKVLQLKPSSLFVVLTDGLTVAAKSTIAKIRSALTFCQKVRMGFGRLL